MPIKFHAAFILILLAPAGAWGQGGEPGGRLRLSPALDARLTGPEGGPESGEARIEVVARLRPGISPAAVAAALEAGGASGIRLRPDIRRLSARAPADLLHDLARSGAVEWIEEGHGELDRDENDGVRRTLGHEALFPLPADTLRGRGVLVGAWEAGHPDIETSGGSWSGHDDLAGRVRTMEPSEVTAHATQVAGLLAGDGSMSSARGGLPHQWKGVAPGVTVLSYSTTDSDFEADELFQAVRSQGIHLSIHSWGESVNRTRCEVLGDYNIRAAEFDQVIAGDDPARAGDGAVPVVFSAGNYQDFIECQFVGGGAAVALFPGFRTINPPHTAKNIITVGAVYSDDRGMTRFSSWGPTDDGRLKPDLVAAGAERTGDEGVTSPTKEPSDTYEVDEGTSYSAAAVAGSLAILIGDRLSRGVPPLPPAAWKALLVESAVDLTADPLTPSDSPLRVVYRGPDYFHGFGMVWLPDALKLALSPDCLLSGVVEPGSERRFVIEYSPGQRRLRATLAWDDPPGDPAAPRALVNDLDLRIVEEFVGGIVRYHSPWVLDPHRPDLPAARGVDRLNNVEQVEIDGSLLGRLTLVVSGAGVARGPQRFWVTVGVGCALIGERSELFRRGDVTQDRRVDIADSISVLQHLFLGGEIACPDAADANDDGRVDIADGIRILAYLFLGTVSEHAPLGGECRSDPTSDRLSCPPTPTCP